MKILGIETSCDETAVAVLEVTPRRIRPIRQSLKMVSPSNPLANRGTSSELQSNSEFIDPQARGEEITVLSSVISSQVKLHARYGGVVPILAAREHVKNIEHVFKLAIKKAGIKNFNKEISLIGATRGPGLEPSLLVGMAFARTLAWKYNKPLVGVNHLEGHIYSNWLNPIGVPNNLQPTTYNPPILNLIVSGGHTELVLMFNHGKYRIIGETLDDAVGEAFDKVARLLGLGYPGGPAISQRAERWSIEMSKYINIKISFPRPMINSKNYNFSHAGLKTSVLYKVRDLKNAGIKLTDNIVNQICYEFQNAALDVLVLKTTKAAKEYNVKSIFLSGGVSANNELRERLATEAKKLKVNYSQPEMEYTGDNAAMIALASYFNYVKNKNIKTAYDTAEVNANLDLNQI